MEHPRAVRVGLVFPALSPGRVSGYVTQPSITQAVKRFYTITITITITSTITIIITIQPLRAFRRAHLGENVFGGLLGSLWALWELDIGSM